MLKGDFFSVSAITTEGNSLNASLDLNVEHPIFAGHFPGQPVVPGVCMMQIVKELTEGALGRSTRLVKADHLKFLNVIDPRRNPHIDALVTYAIDETGSVNVTASLTKGELTFLKFRGVLLPQA